MSHSRTLPTTLILVLLFLMAWIPRAIELDRSVTIDEPLWLTRSANFIQAITHGDLGNTYQREHPGVPIMWLGSLGILQHFPEYTTAAPGQFDWANDSFESWLEDHISHTPLELLAAGRRMVALTIALVLTLLFFPLRKLFSSTLAALVVFAVAWMPYFLASRLAI